MGVKEEEEQVLHRQKKEIVFMCLRNPGRVSEVCRKYQVHLEGGKNGKITNPGWFLKYAGNTRAPHSLLPLKEAVRGGRSPVPRGQYTKPEKFHQKELERARRA